MIFKANNKRTKKKWKDLPKVNRNIQMAWQTLLWYHCCQTDLILDIPLIFKNGRRRKWSTKNANLKNTRSRFSTPWQILKWSFLLKLLTNLNCKLFLWQVLSSPLTAINQMFLTNNKRVTSWFFGTVALTTQPISYLFKFNNRNTKNTSGGCEMCLELTVGAPEWRQWLCSGVIIVNFQQILDIHLVFPSVTLSE